MENIGLDLHSCINFPMATQKKLRFMSARWLVINYKKHQQKKLKSIILYDISAYYFGCPLYASPQQSPNRDAFWDSWLLLMQKRRFYKFGLRLALQ